MKHTIIFTILVTLLCGCVTTRDAFTEVPPEVRKMSYADDRLFSDLMTKPSGVAHMDWALYRHSKQKILRRIEVVTPYDNRVTGIERWFIEHEGGDTAVYLVKMVPDGRGGTYFTVRKE